VTKVKKGVRRGGEIGEESKVAKTVKRRQQGQQKKETRKS
jgi:hypothetical protein